MADLTLTDVEKAYGDVSTNVDRAVSQVLDQSMNFERKWMEETAAAVFERENELNKKEMNLRRKEEELDHRESQISAEHQEIRDAQARIRKMAEQIKDKEQNVKAAEVHYQSELKKCRDGHKKVAEMASRVKKRTDELKAQELAINRRMVEVDALEKQLRHWQLELEEGATNTSFSRTDGSDIGFNF